MGAHMKQNLAGGQRIVAVLEEWPVICSSSGHGRLDGHDRDYALQRFAAVSPFRLAS